MAMNDSGANMDIELIDLSIINRLFSGNKQIYGRIAGIFTKKSEENIAEILKQFEDNDIKNFTISVHGVKGATANLGMLPLSNAAKELEMHGKAEETDMIRDKLPGFIDIYRRTVIYTDGVVNS